MRFLAWRRQPRPQTSPAAASSFSPAPAFAAPIPDRQIAARAYRYFQPSTEHAMTYAMRGYSIGLSAWRICRMKGSEGGKLARPVSRWRSSVVRLSLDGSLRWRSEAVQNGGNLVTECAYSRLQPFNKFTSLAAKRSLIHPALPCEGVARRLRVGLQEGQHAIRR
jgi:hypothetical protein